MKNTECMKECGTCKKSSAYVVGIYAVLVIVGGIMGYIKAGSMISLAAGTGFGIALMLSAWALFKDKTAGFYASVILAITLFAFFGIRYVQSYKFMPAGMMCILSGLVIMFLASKALSKDK